MSLKLSGTIDHVIFRNPDNSYTVLILTADDGADYTCVGILPELDPGESVTFEGEITDNPKYGTQFSVSSFSIDPMDDEVSILRYLSSGTVKGVGPGLAKRIVGKFGEDTFRIIEEEPERLSEIKGISLRMAISIAEAFELKSGSRQAMSFLSGYGITPGLGQKIYEKYKDGVYDVIRSNPYKLIEDIDGVGFISADRIASEAGIAKDSEYRIRSAILYILLENTNSGSMCMTEEDLVRRSVDVLKVDPALVTKRIDSLSLERKLIRETVGNIVFDYAESAYYAEAEAARLLIDLDVGDTEDTAGISEAVSDIEKTSGVVLENMQREAVIAAISHTVSVITGGPGTGKTTITNLMISYFEAQGLNVTLAAPTGRAAKRMSEASDHEAKTIHRLLGVGAMIDGKPAGGFEHNGDNPLETDVIILDEMSMVDIFMFRYLLRAIVPGTRLILVGDADQLPSVGPGAVLKDLISSGCFHVTKLTRIYRQSEASAIVKNAFAVIRGNDIDLDAKNEEFFFLEQHEAERIIQGMIYLAGKKIPQHLKCTPFDIQILTPMRKGILGVENLNTRFQEAMNPPGKLKREISTANGLIRTGDKVMQVKNNYDLPWNLTNGKGMVLESGSGIFNGDIGRVLSVSSDRAYIRFDDGREAEYTGEALSELELAYAITIHKSQGSEYKAVILPLLQGPQMLMNRNLLYTAITRAKQMVCILGKKDTVREMIANEREDNRHTGLERRIKEMVLKGT
ncbi:MAG: ATP-dependent RecD-like DNA helicase [Lachnospiraceae bacterium]|nr:ATP-dependent RecD-like DNA helicase [Lachnospiraceae bacterium]